MRALSSAVSGFGRKPRESTQSLFHRTKAQGDKPCRPRPGSLWRGQGLWRWRPAQCLVISESSQAGKGAVFSVSLHDSRQAVMLSFPHSASPSVSPTSHTVQFLLEKVCLLAVV